MYVLGGSRPSSGKRADLTIYELNACGEGCSPRDTAAGGGRADHYLAGGAA